MGSNKSDTSLTPEVRNIWAVYKFDSRGKEHMGSIKSDTSLTPEVRNIWAVTRVTQV